MGIVNCLSISIGRFCPRPKQICFEVDFTVGFIVSLFSYRRGITHVDFKPMSEVILNS